MSPYLIPIIIFTGGFAMTFGIVYLKTRENMAMIERGLNPKQFANRPAPYRNLKNGLLILGAGLGLLVAYLIDLNMNGGGRYHDSFSEPLYFACVAIGGGLGLIASFAIEKKELPVREGSDL
ncbi:MAG: hypothetical protein JWP27_1962 [Flaviaesturariibacter sp.]|nr:hypothetical protein [Flaviaesturariibacter sp.]